MKKPDGYPDAETMENMKAYYADEGSSERAPSKPAGPAKVVAAVATGSPAAFDAEALLASWAYRARWADEAAARHADEKTGEPDLYWHGRAGVYRLCSAELRHLLGLPDERQPQENT